MDAEPIGILYYDILDDWRYSTAYLVEQILAKIKEAQQRSGADRSAVHHILTPYPQYLVKVHCYNRREAQEAYDRLSLDERRWTIFVWNKFKDGDERPLDETTPKTRF